MLVILKTVYLIFIRSIFKDLLCVSFMNQNPLSGLNGFKIRLVHVFVPKYKQKLYSLKIELFWGIHTILWNRKSAPKCFKSYS